MKVEQGAEQQVTLTSLREVIGAVFREPTSLPSLVYALDALAHVCLLGVRLRSEVARLVDHYDAALGTEAAHTLGALSNRCVEAETALWKCSIWWRELHIVNALHVEPEQLKRLVRTHFPPPDNDKTLSSSPFLRNRAMPARAVARLQIVRVKMDSWLELKQIGEPVIDHEEREAIYGTAAQARAIVSLESHVNTILDGIAKVQSKIRQTGRVKSSTKSRAAIKDDHGGPVKVEPKSAPRDHPPSSTGRAVKSELAHSSPHIKSAGSKIPPANKKRSRPSLPPREGPDYTKPLPVFGSNVKRQRLHPFQTKDLK